MSFRIERSSVPIRLIRYKTQQSQVGIIVITLATIDKVIPIIGIA